MRVLVSAGSKHGGSEEIARAVADVLAEAGLAVDVVAPDRVGSLKAYDAAVIGSGVYAGRWVGAARELVERHADELRRIPVWLFSSGPLGDPLKPSEEPTDALPLFALVSARDHRVFGGRIDRTTLGLGEKLIMAAVRAPDGDFREWTEIRAWGASIARSLAPEALPAG